MSINKQKLFYLLNVIHDKLLLAPKDMPIYLDPFGDLKQNFPEEELLKILLKLQNDEKVIKITKFPIDEAREGEFEDDYYRIITLSSFDKYYSKLNKELNLKESNHETFKITYTSSREILINNIPLARPDFDGINDAVFGFLYSHPNKKHTKKEIENAINKSITKSLHKIVENLGFTGELKEAFIDVNKNVICFKNPVKEINLKNYRIKRIK